MIALVTATAARHLDEDLPLLVPAVHARGLQAEVVVWDDPGIEWSTYDIVVVRSPWDYMSQLDRFLAWAEQVASTARIVNAPDILRWNTDKRYLREIAAKGISIVPTTFLEPGDDPVIGAGEVVVKPAVSAGANDTERFAPDQQAEAVDHATRLLNAGRVVMVQPYVASVDARGETALLYIGGTFSHSITKGPILAPGVQFVEGLYAEERIEPRAPTPDERATAEAVLDASGFRDRLLYARVDLVEGDDGAPLLLELELTEPSLFLAHAPGSPERLAAAIADLLP